LTPSKQNVITKGVDIFGITFSILHLQLFLKQLNCQSRVCSRNSISVAKQLLPSHLVQTNPMSQSQAALLPKQ